MDGNGEHVRRVTTDAATETGAPAWSPDGKLIAFAECCHQLDPANGPVPSLVVVRPDGSGRRVLYRTTNEEFGLDEPAWSPDGRRIVFDYGGYELRVLNADGSGVRPVFPGVAGGDGDPRWSPDGRQIAFASAGGVAVMDANGAHRRHAGVLQTATWSPDGRRIAGENLDNGIDVVDVATGHGHDLIVDSGPGTPTATDPAWSPKGTLAYLADGYVALHAVDAHPATRYLHFSADGGLEWSPDGRLLAFDRNGSIWVYDTGTKHSRRLVANASEAAWSPDGGRIAFVRDVTRTNPEIYVARSDGSGAKRITVNPGFDAAPSWQPLR